MNDKELSDAIMWLYGGHDQFQRDDVLQARVVEELRRDDERALRILTSLAKKFLKPPFTIEDVANFIKYLDHGLEYSI